MVKLTCNRARDSTLHKNNYTLIPSLSTESSPSFVRMTTREYVCDHLIIYNVFSITSLINFCQLASAPGLKIDSGWYSQVARWFTSVPDANHRHPDSVWAADPWPRLHPETRWIHWIELFKLCASPVATVPSSVHKSWIPDRQRCVTFEWLWLIRTLVCRLQSKKVWL